MYVYETVGMLLYNLKQVIKQISNIDRPPLISILIKHKCMLKDNCGPPHLRLNVSIMEQPQRRLL